MSRADARNGSAFGPVASIALNGSKVDATRREPRGFAFGTSCAEMVTEGPEHTRILPHALRSPPSRPQRMSMPAVLPRRWSAADVRELPDEPGKRFECVDGELLVSPSPRLTHQSVVALLWREIEAYVRAHTLGAAFFAPGDLELDAHTLVQPDVYVLPLVDGRRPRTQAEIGQPLLLIEVLSPSTARFDRVIKRHRYQRQGVEY